MNQLRICCADLKSVEVRLWSNVDSPLHLCFLWICCHWGCCQSVRSFGNIWTVRVDSWKKVYAGIALLSAIYNQNCQQSVKVQALLSLMMFISIPTAQQLKATNMSACSHKMEDLSCPSQCRNNGIQQSPTNDLMVSDRFEVLLWTIHAIVFETLAQSSRHIDWQYHGTSWRTCLLHSLDSSWSILEGALPWCTRSPTSSCKHVLHWLMPILKLCCRVEQMTKYWRCSHQQDHQAAVNVRTGWKSKPTSGSDRFLPLACDLFQRMYHQMVARDHSICPYPETVNPWGFPVRVWVISL